MNLEEDLDPKTKKSKPRILDNMSVQELKEYIEDLRAEILRVEDDIKKKEAHKSAADALFGGKTS